MLAKTQDNISMGIVIVLIVLFIGLLASCDSNSIPNQVEQCFTPTCQ